MTHEELLASLDTYCDKDFGVTVTGALRAVVELHKPVSGGPSYPPGFPVADGCSMCQMNYPCPTIQAIEKELG